MADTVDTEMTIPAEPEAPANIYLGCVTQERLEPASVANSVLPGVQVFEGQTVEHK